MKPTTKHTPFWWNVLYNLAPKRVKKGLPPFTERQIKLASDWQTCACGKQDRRIPRYHEWDPYPLDDQLWNAGVKFSKAINRQSLAGARQEMHRIERHAARVLKEVANERKAKTHER